MRTAIHVLLADDHSLVREQFEALIAGQPDMQVVGLAADGQAAVEKALSLRPDVVVMDLSMPVLNGLQATQRLHASRPEIRVVLLTAHQDQIYVEAMEAAGWHGYVLKRSPVEVLLTAIRVVATGGAFLDPALDDEPRLTAPDRPTLPSVSADVLTAQEQAVLQHTARGLTTREITATLGAELADVVATRTRAMAKLGLQNRVALAHYAEQHGWQ